MMADRNRKPTYIRKIKSNAGGICANCGSAEDIEYHHIVPLSLGGQERETNIVALCYKCHKAAHHGRHISHYTNHNAYGRKPKVSDAEAFRAFDLLATGEIGRKKCKELMNLSESTHISDINQYKKYLNARGIKVIKNNVDILGKTGGLKDGVNVGFVKYIDGTDKEIFYHDTGMNDVIYTKRKDPPSRFKIYKTD